MNISIILAAGEGTRMKSKKSKVLHEVCNKPILDYVVKASRGANVSKNIIVVGRNREELMEKYDGEDLIFKEQKIGPEYPYGTGYALMQTIDEIEDEANVLILYGDTPLIKEETIRELLEFHGERKLDGTVLTALVDEPFGYGRIVRDLDGSLLKIVEEKDSSLEEKAIKEINSGIYVFNGRLLKYALGKIDNKNAQNEYYATDVIKVLKDEACKLGAFILEDQEEILGVNSREQLAFCEKVMRDRINSSHMANGVTIIDPSNTYIDDSVIIGRDTIIYPGVTLLGETKIGEDTIIKGDTLIIDSILENNIEIISSTIEESEIKSYTKIGPYSHLRPNSKIGESVKIGNFVEVKNSTLGNGTKASHLAYVGDADIGKDVNIGCGVVFVNYNGREKFRTRIEDNAFIGSNSNLVAPITVNKHAYIAAGSTIVNTVEEGALSIARAKQVDKPGWMEKKGYK